MGKQINYYMGCEEFRELAVLAVESGCVILRNDFIDGRWAVDRGGPELVEPGRYRYFFYLPEAGPLVIRDLPNGRCVDDGYTATGNALIEAGYSRIREEEPRGIGSARLFVISGYYNEAEDWIPRPDCLTKLYEKLARRAKKLAPYTQLEGWQYKVYVSPALRPLLEREGYDRKL